MDVKKVLISVTAFLAGGLSMWVWQQYQEKPRYVLQSRNLQHPFMQDLSIDDFFSRSHDWFQTAFSDELGDVSWREDRDNFYFDIDLKGQTPKKFNVEVHQGLITIHGEIETEEEGTHFTSRFERSFPAPDGVNVEAFRLDPTDGKMTVILPKTS